ncbi:MAG TPA: class I SAM-dependent methyltransferase [Verrucomicrobiales bacterium]|jgi:SAM-dependent methyltransferase|nr:class I SAM-dependent methyltransferase [Verrucomicrobiales bacterium]
MQTLNSILVCPVCRSPELKSSPPECPACGRHYALERGHLNLTPVPPPDADVLEKWDLWEKLQANGLFSYESAPEENLCVGDRPDAMAYAGFCRLDGCLTLDVGCGPQKLPSYGAGQGDRFVGIDPLPGATDRSFHFVQAIAEYLPFRDGTFDRILFGTSLDHFLNPQRALREARRALKPDGWVCIWYGSDDAPPQSAATAPAVSKFRKAVVAWRTGGLKEVWKRVRRKLGMAPPPITAQLEVPQGAVDHYHFFHVDTEHLETWLKEAGFRVENVSREGGGGNVFVRAVPA